MPFLARVFYPSLGRISRSTRSSQGMQRPCVFCVVFATRGLPRFEGWSRCFME